MGQWERKRPRNSVQSHGAKPTGLESTMNNLSHLTEGHGAEADRATLSAPHSHINAVAQAIDPVAFRPTHWVSWDARNTHAANALTYAANLLDSTDPGVLDAFHAALVRAGRLAPTDGCEVSL